LLLSPVTTGSPSMHLRLVSVNAAAARF
jgi:hypothetical protein